MVLLSVLNRYGEGYSLKESIRGEAAASGLPEKQMDSLPIWVTLPYALFVWSISLLRGMSNVLKDKFK